METSEPGWLVLACTGFAGLAAFVRRRTRAKRDAA